MAPSGGAEHPRRPGRSTDDEARPFGVAAEPSAAVTGAAATLAGVATPLEGEAHLKERDWRSFVRLPHRTSFGWGARLAAAPEARLEVTLADGTLLRVVGPAELSVEQGSLDLVRGTMLAQVGRKILTGATRNLRSIIYRAASDSVTIGTTPPSKDYAAIHQFGGKAGRGRKVTIPARPYLGINAEDREEAIRTMKDHMGIKG